MTIGTEDKNHVTAPEVAVARVAPPTPRAHNADPETRAELPGLNPKDAIGRQKAPMHLVPPALYEPVARVMQLGAQKYGAYNWRTAPVNLTVYLDAMKRHWDAVVDGEWVDPESEQPHMAHVAASVAIILDALKHGNLNVDLVTLDIRQKAAVHVSISRGDIQ